MMRPASRCTDSSAGRLTPIVRRGRPPATRVSHACSSAAAFSRSSMTATARYFGRDARDQDQVGYIDANTRAIFGRSYAAEPDVLVKELAGDEAIKAADTLLLRMIRTNWVWTTTPTCSKASLSTSLRNSAGADGELW